MADAAMYALENDVEPGLYNVGCGVDITIEELARAIMRAVRFEGRVEFDATRPDGTPQKLLDVSRLSALGWRARISFAEGLAATYRAFLQRPGP
jgi:GDP-L-fucose synthase